MVNILSELRLVAGTVIDLLAQLFAHGKIL